MQYSKQSSWGYRIHLMQFSNYFHTGYRVDGRPTDIVSHLIGSDVVRRFTVKADILKCAVLTEYLLAGYCMKYDMPICFSV